MTFILEILRCAPLWLICSHFLCTGNHVFAQHLPDDVAGRRGVPEGEFEERRTDQAFSGASKCRNCGFLIFKNLTN